MHACSYIHYTACMQSRSIIHIHTCIIQISRLDNDLLVSRRCVPVSEKLEIDLVNGQVELQCCQDRLQELGQAVECANDPSRLRLLGGDNPSRNELGDKIDALEVRLITINSSSNLELECCNIPLLHIIIRNYDQSSYNSMHGPNAYSFLSCGDV